MVNQFFDKDGTPLTLEEFNEKYTDEYRILKMSAAQNKSVVTVWTGLDNSWGESEKPLIYQTKISDVNDPQHSQIVLYATEEEALAGHDNVMEQLESGQPVKNARTLAL